MGIKRAVFRCSNSILSKFNLELRISARDFDARLDQPFQLRRIFAALAKISDEWLSRQRFFPVRGSFDTVEVLARFYDAFLASPFRRNDGGSRFNNLAWLHLIAKAMQPSFVIDSGTFRGASAWAFSTAGAKVCTFDIDLSRLARRAENVVYSKSDWTAFDWGTTDFSNTLIYFDDHLDQVRRLIEAAQHGIPVAVFDDDFPVTSFAPMAHAGHALPKIEFALDDELKDWRELSWIDRGQHHIFPIDRSYLDQARSLIAATERLPDTSPVTGIQQTPYRIVRVIPSKGNGIIDSLHTPAALPTPAMVND